VSIADFLGVIARVILNPLIIFGFAVALLFFFWGIFEFITSTAEVAGRDKGKKNIVWGIIGMFIMVSVFGIINLILNTFGIDTDKSEYVDTLLK
jgi:hypothetical protein